ncbi:MAG: NERD domain-containing protein [Microbacteriaceae bacterium]|nr:NERD domain-containing protein [Microbacteriaceae bacterium]MCL2794754.1 NERD domain-containing protein [Microbacteriaceae bacterium]
MTDLRAAHRAAEGAQRRFEARLPAASAISACLAAQRQAPPRSLFAKVFGVGPLTEQSRKWYSNAVGEQHVAAELAKLGPDWAVLHSVPVGDRGQTVDHLVIGPGGVFVVDAVHQHGATIDVRRDVRGAQLYVNGAERPYITQSRNVATDAALGLTRAVGMNVPVRGVLVAVSPKSLTVRDQPDDVAVTCERTVRGWLAGESTVLSAAQVSTIADVASQTSTWRGAMFQSRLPAFDPEVFETLRVEVQRAWFARAVWGGALVTAAAIAAVQFAAVV